MLFALAPPSVALIKISPTSSSITNAGTTLPPYIKDPCVNATASSPPRKCTRCY